MSILNQDWTTEDLAALDKPNFQVNEQVLFGINQMTVAQKVSKNGNPFKVITLETKILNGSQMGKPYKLVMTSFNRDQFTQMLIAIFGLQTVKARQMEESKAIGKKIYGIYGGVSQPNPNGQTFDQWSKFLPDAPSKQPERQSHPVLDGEYSQYEVGDNIPF